MRAVIVLVQPSLPSWLVAVANVMSVQPEKILTGKEGWRQRIKYIASSELQ
jgi:hypothetical protein